jgi:hypothetical protein
MTATTFSRSDLVYGDVRCVNCGRTLATAIRRRRDNATAIRPVRATGEFEVEIVNERRLRCRRCRGMAYIEFDEIATAVIEKDARDRREARRALVA